MKKIVSILSLLLVAIFLMPTIASAKKPVSVYLIGDETVANSHNSAQCGWGQALSANLTDDAVVKNFAKAGSSTKSFIAEGEWEKVKEQLRRGDVLIIQFGHNDENADNPAHYTSIADYEKNLQELIKQANKEKAKVILCTPIARRVYNIHTNQLVDTHGAYTKAVRRIAQATKTPIVDLSAMTMHWLNSVDKKTAAGFYYDTIHLTENGAADVAHMVAEEIQKQEIKGVAYLVKVAK